MSETEVFKVSFFTAEDMIQNEVKATITAAKTDAITANFFPLVFFTVSFSLADTFLSGSISISGIFSALSSGGISGSEFMMLFFSLQKQSYHEEANISPRVLFFHCHQVQKA